MEWDAQSYDKNHDFVFKYGANLLELLPQAPKTVLDIGCGTGELTNQIAQLGYQVTGIDQSAAMIQQARKNFPAIDFFQHDILAPITDLPTYEVIFSNAVFHWVANQDLLFQRINELLVPAGELICEFGAVGNIETIRSAFLAELTKFGGSIQESFHFHPLAYYQELLKKHDFKLLANQEYDRPTTLKGGKAGLRHWVEQFYQTELANLTDEQQDQVLTALETKLKPSLWHGDHWEADYRRLRLHAVKN